MDYYLGEIRVFPFSFAPKGWAQCNGQLLSISQNQALFSLLGTFYGGDGRTTFALPNLQGKVMVGTGANSSGTYSIGQTAGEASHTLTTAEMPMHTHFMQAVNALGAQSLGGSDDYLAQAAVYTTDIHSPLYAINGYASSPANPVVLTSNSVATAGGSAPHENRQPFTALNVCICLAGIFPSRN